MAENWSLCIICSRSCVLTGQRASHMKFSIDFFYLFWLETTTNESWIYSFYSANKWTKWILRPIHTERVYVRLRASTRVDGRRRARCEWTFKLVLCFLCYKEYEYTYDRKFIGIFVCQKYQNWVRFDKAIVKMIWCSFLPHILVPPQMLRCMRSASSACMSVYL